MTSVHEGISPTFHFSLYTSIPVDNARAILLVPSIEKNMEDSMLQNLSPVIVSDD